MTLRPRAKQAVEGQAEALVGAVREDRRAAVEGLGEVRVDRGARQRLDALQSEKGVLG